MNLTQRQLQFFVATAQMRHITRASISLNISQPALTRALREFEQQLGVVLFHRSTRQLSLSDEGAQFLPIAQRLLSDMQQAGDDIKALHLGQRGTVKVAVGSAFGSVVLPTALLAFGQTHPAVKVTVIDANSSEITQHAARGEVDFGIGSPIGEIKALDCEKWLSAQLGLLRSANTRQRIEIPGAAELDVRWINDTSGSSIAHVLQSQGSPLLAHMSQGPEVSSLIMQLACVQAGVGVAVISALAASHPLAVNLEFVPLQPRLSRDVFCMQRKDRALSLAAQAFKKALHEAIHRVKLRAEIEVHTDAPI